MRYLKNRIHQVIIKPKNMNVFKTDDTNSKVKETLINKMTEAVNDGVMLGIQELHYAVQEYFNIKASEGLQPFIGLEEFNILVENYIKAKEANIESQKVEYKP